MAPSSPEDPAATPELPPVRTPPQRPWTQQQSRDPRSPREKDTLAPRPWTQQSRDVRGALATPRSQSLWEKDSLLDSCGSTPRRAWWRGLLAFPGGDIESGGSAPSADRSSVSRPATSDHLEWAKLVSRSQGIWMHRRAQAGATRPATPPRGDRLRAPSKTRGVEWTDTLRDGEWTATRSARDTHPVLEDAEGRATSSASPREHSKGPARRKAASVGRRPSKQARRATTQPRQESPKGSARPGYRFLKQPADSSSKLVRTKMETLRSEGWQSSISVELVGAKGLRADFVKGTLDTYCTCRMQSETREEFRTELRHRTREPVWNHHCPLSWEALGRVIEFEVWKQGDTSKKSDSLGKASLQLSTETCDDREFHVDIPLRVGYPTKGVLTVIVTGARPLRVGAKIHEVALSNPNPRALGTQRSRTSDMPASPTSSGNPIRKASIQSEGKMVMPDGFLLGALSNPLDPAGTLSLEESEGAGDDGLGDIKEEGHDKRDSTSSSDPFGMGLQGDSDDDEVDVNSPFNLKHWRALFPLEDLDQIALRYDAIPIKNGEQRITSIVQLSQIMVLLFGCSTESARRMMEAQHVKVNENGKVGLEGLSDFLRIVANGQLWRVREEPEKVWTTDQHELIKQVFLSCAKANPLGRMPVPMLHKALVQLHSRGIGGTNLERVLEDANDGTLSPTARKKRNFSDTGQRPSVSTDELRAGTLLGNLIGSLAADKKNGKDPPTISEKDFLKLVTKLMHEADVQARHSDYQEELSVMSETGLSAMEVEDLRELFRSFSEETSRRDPPAQRLEMLLRQCGVTQMTADEVEAIKMIVAGLDPTQEAPAVDAAAPFERTASGSSSSRVSFGAFLKWMNRILNAKICGLRHDAGSRSIRAISGKTFVATMMREQRRKKLHKVFVAVKPVTSFKVIMDLKRRNSNTSDDCVNERPGSDAGDAPASRQASLKEAEVSEVAGEPDEAYFAEEGDEAAGTLSVSRMRGQRKKGAGHNCAEFDEA